MTQEAAQWFVDNETPAGIILYDEMREFCVFRNRTGEIRFKHLKDKCSPVRFTKFVNQVYAFLGMQESMPNAVFSVADVQDLDIK